jgi:peptide/nickel transport system permease protein
MISSSRGYMLQDPWYLFWPCLVMVVTILAINTFGDAIRDRLDPRRVRAAP